jgi:hypothetical protein
MRSRNAIESQENTEISRVWQSTQAVSDPGTALAYIDASLAWNAGEMGLRR